MGQGKELAQAEPTSVGGVQPRGTGVGASRGTPFVFAATSSKEASLWESIHERIFMYLHTLAH